MKHLIIIGVGGFAREVCHSAKESVGYGEDWDIKGFLNGDVRLPDEEYNKLALPVLGDVNDYKIQKDDVFICAVGNPNVKFKLIQPILNRGGEFINLLHRTTRISVTAKMGVGNIFVPYTGLNDHAVIGDYITFNTYSGLGHDASVGDYSVLSSQVDIMGYAKVGKMCFLGSGARVMPHGKVEDNVNVGVLYSRKKKYSCFTFIPRYMQSK